jgi:hypothetical protein
MSALRYRTATAPLTGCGHILSHGPAVRVWDAARLSESVQSRGWRSGLVQPSDPARGCRDWLAGLAAKQATPCSVTGDTYTHTHTHIYIYIYIYITYYYLNNKMRNDYFNDSILQV